ncbi:MAG: hypothetical protein HY321_12380 [Armatimonadetes bacterium]|nr:hypothetical protein [Armatimonadota bacterium]
MAKRRWWDAETPVVFASGRNVFRFYHEADRLVVSKPDWEDTAGAVRMGKSVGVDLAALEEAEPEDLAAAIRVLSGIVERLKGAALVMGSGAEVRA